MARRAFSALGLALLSSAVYAQAFGRFGYEQSVEVPGFKVDKEGFVANDPLADKVRFASPSKSWKPVSTSSTEQTVQLDTPAGGPQQALFSLLGVGFSLYFGAGIDLQVRSFGAPYLSWEQGTVADNVATPDARWLVLSFRDRQPPIAIGFPNGRVSLIVTGSAGNWSVKSDEKFQGWVRFGLPQGLDAPLANSAAALGRVAKVAAENAKLWTSMPPKLLKTSIASDLHSVTATWQFDRPGAVVPEAADLANLGDYLLKIYSPTVRLPGWTEAGPTTVLSGDSLKIRFPVKRVPTGRCLAAGIQLPNPSAGVSPEDIPSVARLALQSLVAERDSSTRRSSEETTSQFISQATYSMEPWTQQQLPFDRLGKGIDLAAAHALLMQAVTSTSQATSESNSLLTSVSWRQDWLTWMVWTPDITVSRRAGALAALAGCLCPEPERRLAAAMFQAGLSGHRGLFVWRRRQGMIDNEPKQIEPLLGVRQGLFGLEGAEEEGERFALTLLSPIRVFSNAPVSLAKRGKEYVLQTKVSEVKQVVVMLASEYPLLASRLTNIAYLKVASALGFTELRFLPDGAGVCEFKLTLPSYGQAPPAAAPVPDYSEKAR